MTIHGILPINKPSGMTSHDVVARVRRILKEKRIGHTGTLDPLATGVLVLCIGKATRIARFLEAHEKEYSATLRLGITTDTLDAAGRVLNTTTYVSPDREKILEVLKRFTGQIEQIPPAYSALKIRGVPSYKLARQGKAEELKARTVTIHRITMISFDDPFMRIDVRCSKGVYIRSLCADIGAMLGMGAHLTELIRMRSGRFTLEKALSLDEVQDAGIQALSQNSIISIDEALEDMPVVVFREQDAGKIAHGGRVELAGGGAYKDGDLVRVHDDKGALVALAKAGPGEFRPEIVFSQNS